MNKMNKINKKSKKKFTRSEIKIYIYVIRQKSLQVYILYILFIFSKFVQTIKCNMKLYNSKPQKLIRVNIKQAGQPVIHLAFDECELLDCAEALLSYIKSGLPQKNSSEKYKIIIQCREWENSKNGLSTSFSFVGPDSSFVRDCIVSHFDN